MFRIKPDIKEYTYEYQINIEEIRLRNGKPINIYLKGRDYFVTQGGSLTKNMEEGVLVERGDINKPFNWLVIILSMLWGGD